MKAFLSSLFLFLAFVSITAAQQKFSFSVQIDWTENGLQRAYIDGTTQQIPFFKDAYFSNNDSPLPVFHKAFNLEAASDLKTTITNIVSEPIDIDYDYSGVNESNELIAKATVTRGRRQYIGHVDICPLIFDGQTYRKVISFDLNVLAEKSNKIANKNPPTTTESVLADGDIYKIAVQSEGMHVIDMNFLSSELGIDISSVSPSQFQIFGSGGGMVKERNDADRVDDLAPVAMQMIGTADGSFDNGDRIIFYAEGATVDQADISTRRISRPINVYDEENFYFIKIGNVNQSNIEPIASVQNTQASTDQFDGFVNVEEDNINVLHEFAFTQGSGFHWYMQKFEGIREQTYNFTIPNIVTSENMTVESVFAGRSDSGSRYVMEIDGVDYQSGFISNVNTSTIETSYATRINFIQEVIPSTENVSVTVKYEEFNFASTGWLDYIHINARQRLIMEGNEMVFRDFESLDNTSTTFNIQTPNSDLQVWNISNPLNPNSINGSFNNGTYSFGANTSTLQKFIAFDLNAVNKTPTAVGQIENQNLHQIAEADMIVIYPIEFEEQANEFAQHRSNFSQLDVKTVLIDEIYNEFSSGRVDPSAIRDFSKLLFDRDTDFRYLLLFGDGSFDHRGVYDNANGNNPSNFIPVFEVESLNTIFAYPTDDYFGLLDPEEGGSISGGIDISIGRFPVKTTTEARLVVNKIINYETNPESFGNWRNDVVFVADDEDSNTHLDDADGIAERIRADHNEYNINKLYADSYRQISTPGGEKYPGLTEDLNKVMFQGALTVNYLGHGGSKGWAQERFLDLNDIDGWSNNSNLPLLVTATCSFTGYDDPTFVTAGERAFLNPNGGVIGLMTTVRAVFASENERLTRSVFDRIFEKEDGRTIPFGDVMLRGKNVQSGNNQSNERKFSLIGDPSMRIAIPMHKVETLSINGNALDTIPRDTIHALDQVTVSGQITDQNDQLLSDFNGRVFVKVFDKVNSIRTLANDPGSNVTDFKSQKNLIFTGVASVTNGLFNIKFVVPRDIDYSFGTGKISYYATNDSSEDAGGFFTNFIVGGTNPDGVVDNEPPTVEVFMDTENFVLGGVTTPDPVLLVNLSDNLGINVAGTSIGHDLTGILDQDNNNAFALNDFYEAKIDDYTQGTVRFPLFNLATGRHEITVKAWDVANNSAEGFTEFIVAETQNLALEQVLNYPNPFTTNTQFMFEHNLPGQLLDVQVRIFTVSGKLVKSINATGIISDGNSVRNINWDGKDDFGSDIARGVYLYKVKAAPADNSSIDAAESEFEKLVILK